MVPFDVAPRDPSRNAWIVLACVNAGAPTFGVWAYHTGSINFVAASLSVAFVLLMLNSVVLWTLLARSKRNGWPLPMKQMGLAAGVMAVIALLITAVGASLVKQRNSYFELAMSDTPLSSIEPERERLVVEYIRRAAANSQEENKAMAEAQKVPINPAVYSPGSFVTQDAMRRTVSLLAAYTGIDFGYFAKQDAVREDFHRKMAACDPEYLKSWDADRGSQDELEKSANQLEHDWLASVDTLYSYTERHADQIKVKQGKISIPNKLVRDEFDDLLGHSKALHEKLESVVQEELRLQQQAKASAGR